MPDSVLPGRWGGDFYDFFFIDQHHLCVCVGDVSGKGVPAAIYMAVTLTLIRSIARQNHSPAEILIHMNDELCAQNNGAMFVTLFAGILDVRNGNFTYTNAGHNPSFLVKVNGKPTPLKKVHGIPLGIFSGEHYEQGHLRLGPKDFLFAYTDGVTDSRNEKKEFFGDSRLAELIFVEKKNSVETIVESVFEGTRLFVGNTEQYDDTTVMVLQYKGIAMNEPFSNRHA